MTTLERLQRAKARIEKGWVQGMYAGDGTGLETHSDADDACEWCLLGALGDDESIQYTEARRLTAKAAGCSESFLDEWNDADRRTKKQVLNVLDQAIALALTKPTRAKKGAA